ncbi:MAG: hypothetical protein KBD78_15505 [Oligoflexales bacterium]|nr:hypothetical protein [Oligoflexales bacterium]
MTDGKKYFIARSKTKYGMYPTNPKFAEFLADDKATTKRFLKKFGFRIIKGKLFHISKNKLSPLLENDKVSSAFKYAEKISYPVFVKPNSGSRGSNAKIIFNRSGLKKHITHLKSEKVKSFLVEKFTVRPEYRIFIVNGKVEFMYQKQRITITGTGKHTISELLAEKNFQPDKEYLKQLLKKEKKNMRSILDTNKELTMQETANISLGAKIIDYRDKVPKQIHRWAKSISRTTGLNVLGVDVFTKGSWDDPSNYLIIEVNSNPALSGIFNKGNKEKAYSIWGNIFKNFFSHN